MASEQMFLRSFLHISFDSVEILKQNAAALIMFVTCFILGNPACANTLDLRRYNLVILIPHSLRLVLKASAAPVAEASEYGKSALPS